MNKKRAKRSPAPKARPRLSPQSSGVLDALADLRGSVHRRFNQLDKAVLFDGSWGAVGLAAERLLDLLARLESQPFAVSCFGWASWRREARELREALRTLRGRQRRATDEGWVRGWED